MLESSTNQELLLAWQGGNEGAAQVLVQRYLVRLTALARSRLSRKLARRLDPEDVVLSAWRSFFVAADAGRLSVPADDNLWPLLVTMTLRKLARQSARHGAKRRALKDEICQENLDFWQEAVSREPSPQDAALVVDEVESLMAQLEATDREILSRRLRGDPQSEIALALNCSERTIRRSLQRIRALFLQRQEGSGEFTVEPDQENFGPGPQASSPPVPSIVGKNRQPEPMFAYSELRLQKLIGYGGFGKVYRANRTSDGSVVAVKFLKKPFWKDQRAVQALIDEATGTAALSHPNIVRYLGWGKSPQGAVFLVMDWVNGPNMRSVRTQCPLTVPEILHCGIAISEALIAAHAAGILHGDITPANVLLSANGTPLLSDFGFASSLSHPQRAHLGGTPGFLAPEQISDFFGPANERTDVYGLGGLLYALISGRAPVDGRDVPDILANTLSSQSPICLRSEFPDIPSELDVLMRWCLNKEPAKRPASVADVLGSLRGITDQWQRDIDI